MGNKKVKIMICEDTLDLQQLMKKLLTGEGYEVKVAGTGKDCLEALSSDFRILLLDVRLPDTSGIEILKQVKPLYPALKVIVITAFSTIDNAVEAIKLGAENYIAKPFENAKLVAAVKDLADPTAVATADFVIAEDNKLMLAIKDTVENIGDKNVSVLFKGESGTGKELLAKYAHKVSTRAKGPFVPVNCPAIPKSLFEAELFGYEKGAFTGATQKKKGKIELAEGGTLFLDEVADLPPDGQAKLLRVLQEKEIEPLGSGQRKKVNFRVFCATSKDLRQEVERERFRLDLFYRLAEVEIRIPPLRERPSDVPALMTHFCQEFAQEHGLKPREFSATVVKQFSAYSWPGNIRELRSAVRRILILDQTEGAIDAVPEGILLPVITTEMRVGPPPPSAAVDKTLSIQENEKQLIEEALRATNNNMTEAAKILNIGRTTLYRKVKKFKIVA